MNDIALAKAQLRSKILAERSNRISSEVTEIALTQLLLELVERSKPTRVATYISFGSEPSTQLFINELITHKIEVIVPKVSGTDLKWFRFDGRSTVYSALGMQEPDIAALEEVTLLPTDLMIIPALAVDRMGNRLGRGKGFFDRALAGMSNLVFAVCFEAEYIETLPSEEHDRKVQGLVTELAIHDLN